MCYYNGIKVSKLEYIELMRMEKDIKAFIASDMTLVNGFDYGNYPIIKPLDGGKDFEIKLAHWEFIPYFVKKKEDLKAFRQKYTTMNVKCESLIGSRMFGDAPQKRRCLVLSSGFYEWRAYKPEGAKKPEKYPYYIHLPNKQYFFMAGIWNTWVDAGEEATGEIIDTFAIVTTEANPLMAQVHNSKLRMPTILPEDLAIEWLQPGLSDERIKEIASYQFPADQMAAYPIHKEFRIIENPTEPFEYMELPALVSM